MISAVVDPPPPNRLAKKFRLGGTMCTLLLSLLPLLSTILFLDSGDSRGCDATGANAKHSRLGAMVAIEKIRGRMDIMVDLIF